VGIELISSISLSVQALTFLRCANIKYKVIEKYVYIYIHFKLIIMSVILNDTY